MSHDGDPWYAEEETHAETSWNKMQEDFVNIGYREGITMGKENALQEGFDDGFATVGAPLGRQIGVLRGTVNALLGSLQQSTLMVLRHNLQIQEGLEPLVKDLKRLSQRLGNIRLKDIATRDLQAEAHAREHRDIEAEGTNDAIESTIMELEIVDQPNATQELTSIQQEVQVILEKLEVNVTF